MLSSISGLIKDEGGATAVEYDLIAALTAMAAVAVIKTVSTDIATDVGRAYLVKVRLGAALDAAALAVGSETNQTNAQMSTDLQNYFTANYPATALGTNVTVAPVPADAVLSGTTVNYQAQATVPMLFMALIGIDNITVTVTAQTQKDDRPRSCRGARPYRATLAPTSGPQLHELGRR
jgi:Flp pilus assembly pilin Flp